MKKKIILFFKNNYYFLTSFLIFMSFPSYDIWFLRGYLLFAWVSLVPLFLYIRDKSIGKVYLAAFSAGLAGNYLAFSWIGHFAGKIEGGYTLIVSLLIPFLTVFFAGRIFIAEILSRRHEKLRYLIYPSVWIIMDWIVSIGFLAFPWTYWGYSQYQFKSFIQISSVVGVLGINFLMIMFNYLLAHLIYRSKKENRTRREILKLTEAKGLMVLTGIIVLSVIYGSAVLSANRGRIKRDLRLSIIQSCISPWENWRMNKFRYLDELIKYTDLSLAEDPDFVIWSESATLETISFRYREGSLSKFDKRILNYVRSIGRPLLTGEIGVKEIRKKPFLGYPQNNGVLINKNGEVVMTYPKINLVPFGEWFPYGKWLPSVKKIAASYGGSNFIPGEGPMIFELMKKKFAVLICYEGIFYRLCREYKNRGAQFFVNITNDGWTDTYSGHMQHYSASVFRAIENGIWYIRAGNTGYSAIIDPYGRAVKTIPILKQGYLTGDIDFSYNHATIYSYTGDVILYISMIFILLITMKIFVEIIKKMNILLKFLD